MNSRVPTPVSSTPAIPVRVRPRVEPRAVDLSAATEAPAYYTALEDAVRANREKNIFSGKESKARKELGIAMAQARIDTFDHTVDGKVYTTTFKASETDEVDVKALYEAVGLDTFLAIVTASQGAVKEKVGSNVLALVTKKKAVAASVKFAEKK